MATRIFFAMYLFGTIEGIAISSCLNEYPPTKQGYVESLKRILELKSENRLLEEQNLTHDDDIQICSKGTQRPQLEGDTYTFQKVTERNVLVFSGFHESRSNAGGPAVRVLSLGHQRDYKEVGALWCTLWYYDRKYGISVGPAEYDVIFPSRLHHEMWCEHFIICPLPKNISDIPYAVSVTDKPCAKPENNVYITNRGVVNKKGKFAVCYPSIYGKFRDWRMLVEFFEFQRLLGAEEITIYKYSVTNETDKTLNYFHKQGWVNVIPWPYPGLPTHTFFQRAAVNDCIYRNMQKYDYVAVHDLDEVLMPRAFDNWPQLFENVDTLNIENHDYGAFYFQHLYFRRNNTSSSVEHNHISNSKESMITSSSFYRTDVVTPAGKVRCKTMYKTDKVLKADLHFQYNLVPGSKEYLLDPEIGALHHYRISPMEHFHKYPERYNFIEDRYAETFSQKLIKVYEKHIEMLHEIL